MRKSLKHFFIPHAANNYKPHILHPKRALFYSLVGVLIKAILITFAVLVPTQAFLLPDVLQEQYNKIITLTNTLRQEKGLSVLAVAPKLNISADAKAQDMADHQYFSHTGPNNHTLAYFLHKSSYPYSVAGENLAMGFADAESLVTAWEKSPTHYANLVDTDFTEFGVGLESGMYSGEQTVYVVQHFGTPQSVLPKKNKSVQTFVTSSVAVALANRSPAVKSLKINSVTQPPTAVVLNKEKSHVFWLENNGVTLFEVRAILFGPVASAVVTLANYPIELHPNGKTNQFVGKLTVNEPVDTFFRPVIVPNITITDTSGRVTQGTIDWYTIKLTDASPWQKYIQAKNMLAPLTNLFSASRVAYLALIIFFTIALLINILVEVRKQHYHIIVQTLLMLGFLLILWWV